ncbi:MAG: hypothetical protein ACJ8AW_16745, partial [Rhodopila sp.]
MERRRGKVAGARSDLTDVRALIDGLYGTDLHAKRIASLADATLGVMQAASLAVAMIGQALAQARGLVLSGLAPTGRFSEYGTAGRL